MAEALAFVAAMALAIPCVLITVKIVNPHPPELALLIGASWGFGWSWITGTLCTAAGRG